MGGKVTAHHTGLEGGFDEKVGSSGFIEHGRTRRIVPYSFPWPWLRLGHLSQQCCHSVPGWPAAQPPKAMLATSSPAGLIAPLWFIIKSRPKAWSWGCC